jgi:hypothetical protein
MGLGGGIGLQREEKMDQENWPVGRGGSKIEKRKRNGVGRLEAFGPKQLRE